MAHVLYVYAVTRDAVTPECEGVDGTRRFGVAQSGALCAVFTAVSAEEFSQSAIDSKASDLEWIGAIGYRHQDVVRDLMRTTAVVPLRAFTLFSSEPALRSYLAEHEAMLTPLLARLDGKQEWTLRVELDPAKWNDAITRRVESLAALQREAETASSGKAFLLRKKLDEEKKRASRTAEESLVDEIAGAVRERLRCETLIETRERREGAFPQVNVLLNRDEEAGLQEVQQELSSRYGDDGVAIALSGPWPPYTFAAMTNDQS